MTDGVQETSNPLREAQVRDRQAAAKANPCVHRPRHLDRHKGPFLRLMISLDATEAPQSDVYDSGGDMGEVDARLSHGEAEMDHLEFCDRSIGRVPGHEPQNIAEAIVTRLALDGGWG